MDDKKNAQMEMFSIIDMDAVKAGARSNKFASSVKLNSSDNSDIGKNKKNSLSKSEQKLTPEEELKVNQDHFNMEYSNLFFDELNIVEHEFENCTFKSCHFIKHNFTSTIFRDCLFSNCEIVVPKFINTVLDRTRFKGCKLMGIDFSDCVDLMFTPIFDDSLITSCVFEGNKMIHVPFFDCKVRDCGFTYCDMTDTCFDRTTFENTTFTDCQMDKADFTDAHGYEINPYNNKIKGAKFSLPDAQSFLYYLGIKIE